MHKFHDQPENLVMPRIAPGSFEKKLYSMCLSYLSTEKVAFDLKMNVDERGRLWMDLSLKRMFRLPL